MRVRWLLVFTLLVTVLGNFGVTRATSAAPASPAVPVLVADCKMSLAPNSSATWKICFPVDQTTTPPTQVWNNSVVVWAHGYQAPGFVPTYQDDIDGISAPNLIASRGFAFITTTYPKNGLVVLDAEKDLLALVDYFKTTYPETALPLPRKVYLAGISMGGLITTQLAEQTTGKFDGALALCGVVGDFKRQINYWGDFKALYRTLFPNVVASWPTLPISMTTEVTWTTVYQPAIYTGVISNTAAAAQLLAASKAVYDTTVPTTVLTTILGLTYFSFLSEEEAALRLGGNPVENRSTWYRGLVPANNMALNKAVPRTAASAAALTEMQKYETTGLPKIPMVMAHTILDPFVPVDQSLRYILKAKAKGVDPTKFVAYLGAQYGHCTFTQAQFAESFGTLVYLVTGIQLAQTQAVSAFVPDTELQTRLADLAAAIAVPDPNTFTRTYLPLVSR